MAGRLTRDYSTAVLVAVAAGFLIAFAGALPIAGPVAVMAAEKALSHRTREALWLAAGAAIPEGLYAAAACLGAEALLAQFPKLVPLTHVAGGVFLAAVAVALWRQQQAGGPVRRYESTTFGTGFVLTILNPTLLVTWTAASGPLVGFGALATPSHAAIFGLGCAVGGFAGTATLVWGLASQRHRFTGGRTTVLRRGAALLLLGFAAVLLAQAALERVGG